MEPQLSSPSELSGCPVIQLILEGLVWSDHFHESLNRPNQDVTSPEMIRFMSALVGSSIALARSVYWIRQ